MHPFISLSTDFGPGNKGIGVMKATVLALCPDAVIIDLAHDITGFNMKEGAKLFEAAAWLPKGQHICVVDPGVGTKRRGIVIETGRGDHLIGPDNGVLIPATRFLGGIHKAHQLTNEKLMRQPVSPIFHGRDVFAPAAGHLAAGIPIEKFGPAIAESDLVPGAYEEAYAKNGSIEAEIILMNHFGSVFFNIRAEEMHRAFVVNNTVCLVVGDRSIALPYKRTFGEVPEGQPLIMDDDFGRVEAAVNLGSFAQNCNVAVGDRVQLRKR